MSTLRDRADTRSVRIARVVTVARVVTGSRAPSGPSEGGREAGGRCIPLNREDFVCKKFSFLFCFRGAWARRTF